MESDTPEDAKRAFLAHRPPVVIWAADLAHAGWKSSVAEILHCPDPPAVILSLHPELANLWAEALDLGCYDVLALPYVAAEVVRVIQMALNSREKMAGGRTVAARRAAGARAAAPTFTAGAS